MADHLITLVVAPQLARAWRPAEWSLALRQARQSRVLASLGHDLLGEPMPPQAALMLAAARRDVEDHHTQHRQELAHLAAALEPLGLPWVLLKGAAYLARGLPVSLGRSFSDIDLLVAREHLLHFEGALLAAGWLGARKDEHDDRFYREWSHEVPPVTHVVRGGTVDLHHALAPPLGRYPVDTALLLQDAQVLPGQQQMRTLSDLDMVLHSALHLVVSGEFDRGFRDLLDVDRLVRHFSLQQPDFEQRLCQRAQQLGLADVLAVLQGQRRRILQVPRVAVPRMPMVRRIKTALLQPLYGTALRPHHASCSPWWRPLAEGLLYARAHLLRLPLRILLPHLWRKAQKRRADEQAKKSKPAG